MTVALGGSVNALAKFSGLVFGEAGFLLAIGEFDLRGILLAGARVVSAR